MPDQTMHALVKAAAAAATRAHCPYSKYHVGAALLTAEGRVFTGCNVENASYGLTICAERNALFHAVAENVRRFTAIAIVAEGAAVPYPCGACRQVLAEFCDDALPVYIAVRDRLDAPQAITLGQLLPHAFRL